jgi:hypothetical protein
MADNNKLRYSSAFWKEELGEEFSFKIDIKQRLHLIFSLLVFLRVTVLELLVFIFSSRLWRSGQEHRTSETILTHRKSSALTKALPHSSGRPDDVLRVSKCMDEEKSKRVCTPS